MKYLRIALLCFVLLLPVNAFASGAWSTSPSTTSSPVPEKVGNSPVSAVFYRFDDAVTDSLWMFLQYGHTYSICLDGDVTATTAGATVKIWRSISSPSMLGGYVIMSMTLTGTWPTDCIEGVPGDTYIMVEVISNAGSDDAVVSVRRE